MKVIELIGPPRVGKTSIARCLWDLQSGEGVDIAVAQDRNHAKRVNVPLTSPLWQVEYMHEIFRSVADAKRLYRDVLVLDRGFTDCLCWIYHFSSLRTESELDMQLLAHSNYMGEFMKLVGADNFYKFHVMGLTPDEMMERHIATGVHDPVDDPVMNLEVLRELQTQYDALRDMPMLYGKTDPKINAEAILKAVPL